MNWLWKWIARWWRSGYTAPPRSIAFRSWEKGAAVVKQGEPLGVCGLHLIVETHGHLRGRELVSAGAALDRATFWKCWRYFGGQVRGWVDEDGNEVDLTA